MNRRQKIGGRRSSAGCKGIREKVKKSGKLIVKKRRTIGGTAFKGADGGKGEVQKLKEKKG